MNLLDMCAENMQNTMYVCNNVHACTHFTSLPVFKKNILESSAIQSH